MYTLAFLDNTQPSISPLILQCDFGTTRQKSMGFPLDLQKHNGTDFHDIIQTLVSSTHIILDYSSYHYLLIGTRLIDTVT